MIELHRCPLRRAEHTRHPATAVFSIPNRTVTRYGGFEVAFEEGLSSNSGFLTKYRSNRTEEITYKVYHIMILKLHIRRRTDASFLNHLKSKFEFCSNI